MAIECARCGHGKGNVHDLKIWPMFFSQILSGHKSFELRKDDRGFACGDLLQLREWDPETEAYTGRETFRAVASIIHQHAGLSDGYVLMGLVPA